MIFRIDERRPVYLRAADAAATDCAIRWSAEASRVLRFLNDFEDFIDYHLKSTKKNGEVCAPKINRRHIARGLICSASES